MLHDIASHAVAILAGLLVLEQGLAEIKPLGSSSTFQLVISLTEKVIDAIKSLAG